MLVDHVDDVLRVRTLSSFTPRAFLGFDAAEIFVFISGFVCGISFQRRLERDGFLSCQRYAAHRAFLLYLVNLGLLAFALAFSTIVSKTPAASLTGYRFEFPDNVVTAVLCVGGMMYQPYGADILVLYMQFIFLIPVALWVWHRSRIAGLLVVANLYLFAHSYPDVNLPQWPFGSGASTHSVRFFNHFAWQALFLGGLYLGTVRHARTPSARWSTIGSLGLATAIIVAVVLQYARHFAADDLTAYLGSSWWNKPTLGPLRLVEFAAWMTILNRIVPVSAVARHTRVLSPLLACGRHSLACFVVVEILTLVAVLYAKPMGSSFGPVLVWNMGCLVAILSVGILLDRHALPKETTGRALVRES